MTDGNKYLSHILVKGLKNDAVPVISWLSEVFLSSDTFSNLIKQEEKNNSVTMVLNCLKGGLYSKHKDIAIWTAKIFTKLANNFLQLQILEQAWQWYVKVGLDGTMYFLKKHNGMEYIAFDLMVSMGQQHLFALFTEHHKASVDINQYWNNNLLFIKPLHSLMAKSEEVEEIIKFWINSLCSVSGDEVPNEKTVVVNALVDAWLLFPNAFEENEKISEYTLSLLTRHTRDKNSALCLFSLGNLFKLLETLALRKSSYAPLLYKALTFSLVENYSLLEIREFSMESFKHLFNGKPSIPVGILIDPLIKQMQLTEPPCYNLIDFHFFSVIVANQKLNIKNGLQLLDVLARVLLNDPLFGPSSSQLFLTLIRRWPEDESIEKLLEKFVKIALSTLIENIKKSFKPHRNSIYKLTKKHQNLPDPLIDMQTQCIIDTLKEVKDIGSESIKSSIHNNALTVYGNIRQKFSIELMRLRVLIKGNPDKLLSVEEERKNEKKMIPKTVKRSVISLERKKPTSHQSRDHSVTRGLYFTL